MPTALQWAAYVLIGVQVGLRFTRASLASITRMLPVVLALIVAMIALTAATRGGARLATPGRRADGVPRDHPGRAVRRAGDRGRQRART